MLNGNEKKVVIRGALKLKFLLYASNLAKITIETLSSDIVKFRV
jgi:hypothetical protein